MKPDHFYRTQVAALPVRGKAGRQEVLLVTSRDTGRWIIPKGWPMRGKKDHEAAAQEALEEAGIKGRIHHHPMGTYTYEKRSESGVEPVWVVVYLLEVKEEKKVWREQDQRVRRWMSAEEAASLVAEAGLSEIIKRLNVMGDVLSSSQLGS